MTSLHNIGLSLRHAAAYCSSSVKRTRFSTGLKLELRVLVQVTKPCRTQINLINYDNYRMYL